jgi:hypothetical protein
VQIPENQSVLRSTYCFLATNLRSTAQHNRSQATRSPVEMLAEGLLYRRALFAFDIDVNLRMPRNHT